MNEEVSALPAGFADLEGFVAGWADATADAREAQRHRATPEAVATFHATMQPRLDAVFAHLDAYDVRALPPREATLLRLAFGYIEAALVVEILGAREVPGTRWPHGFSITRDFLSAPDTTDAAA